MGLTTVLVFVPQLIAYRVITEPLGRLKLSPGNSPGLRQFPKCLFSPDHGRFPGAVCSTGCCGLVLFEAR